MKHYAQQPRYRNNLNISWQIEKEMGYIYTMGYYSLRQKKEILPFIITERNLDNIGITEIKDKFCKTSQK